MLLLTFVESAEVCVCLHAFPCRLIHFHLKLTCIRNLWRWHVGTLSALVIETLLWQEFQSFWLASNNGLSGTSSPEALGKLTHVEFFGLSFVKRTVFLLIHVDQLQTNVSMYSQKCWYRGSPPPRTLRTSSVLLTTQASSYSSISGWKPDLSVFHSIL